MPPIRVARPVRLDTLAVRRNAVAADPHALRGGERGEADCTRRQGQEVTFSLMTIGVQMRPIAAFRLVRLHAEGTAPHPIPVVGSVADRIHLSSSVNKCS